MSFINYASKELNFKIVYTGAGLAGKTANLEWIYKHSLTKDKSELQQLNTDSERTLFFDFMAIDLGEINGFKLRFHIYTVPGQVYHKYSRKNVLKGVDGVIFVADSQIERMDANLEAIDDLKEHLAEYYMDFKTKPYVLQLNKRDLPEICSVDEMTAELQQKNEPVYEAMAANGVGVFETFRACASLVIKDTLQQISA